jgi:hypothetical protein
MHKKTYKFCHKNAAVNVVSVAICCHYSPVTSKYEYSGAKGAISSVPTQIKGPQT